MPRVDGDDQMAGIEAGGAILVHELDHRKQDAAAGSAEVAMYRQCRNLGNLPFLDADSAQVEDSLQRDAERALPDQRNGADHLAVIFGAQGRRCRQGVIDRYPQAGRVRCHEAAFNIGIMQQ